MCNSILDALPYELWLVIFKKLDHKSLCNFSEADTTCNRLAYTYLCKKYLQEDLNPETQQKFSKFNFQLYDTSLPNISCFLFSPPYVILGEGFKEKAQDRFSIEVINTQDKAHTIIPNAHAGPITCLQRFRDTLLSSSRDEGTILEWNLSTPNQATIFYEDKDYPCIAFKINGYCTAILTETPDAGYTKVQWLTIPQNEGSLGLECTLLGQLSPFALNDKDTHFICQLAGTEESWEVWGCEVKTGGYSGFSVSRIVQKAALKLSAPPLSLTLCGKHFCHLYDQEVIIFSEEDTCPFTICCNNATITTIAPDTHGNSLFILTSKGDLARWDLGTRACKEVTSLTHLQNLEFAQICNDQIAWKRGQAIAMHTLPISRKRPLPKEEDFSDVDSEYEIVL